jgi:transcription initiation factor TFIIIB Brf1 subunit/transcription initiation factor TFIIB
MNILNYKNFISNLENNNMDNMLSKNETVSCTSCISDENDIIESDGFYVCILCGIVIGQRISDLAEWSNYTDSSGCSSNNSRCGNVIKSTDINPFTTNSSSFVPKGVNNVCYENGKIMKYDISRVHMKNNFNHLQKSFNIVEDHMDHITNDKYSKRVVMTAKTLWGEIMNTTKTKENGDLVRKITRAGVRKGLIACCLYYSCIHYDSTRSPLEICQDFGMPDTKQFNKGDKEFKEVFENVPKWCHLLTKTSNSEDYFSRFCSELEMHHIIKEGVAFNLAKDCREIYEQIKDKLHGLFPKSSACGIIFWVMKHKKISITKTNLSKVLGICGPSLSKCCSIVVEILGNP